MCVTGEGTGVEADIARIRQFKDAVGDFPLIICSGINAENAKEQLKIADGAVVGSYFKDTYKDTGDVCAEHVQAVMKEIRELRKELADD